MRLAVLVLGLVTLVASLVPASRAASTGCSRYALASSIDEIAYFCAVAPWPNPAICGKMNHIQWVVLRPLLSSARTMG